MSLDRILRWRSVRDMPEQAELQAFLEDFFGTRRAGEVRWEEMGSRFYITLPGKPKDPFARVPGSGPRKPLQKQRWLEVFVCQVGNTKYINVLTRQQDDYTHALAEGLVACMTRFWGGEIE